MSDYILELKGITKVFPGVKALDNVHFKLKKGEIHALMGENGAGKSTFIKVITGVHQPDEGEMFLNGEKVVFKNTQESRIAGIAAIYQHIIAYPDLSVAENIFLGHELTSGPIKKLDWDQMRNESDKLLRRLKANFSSRDRMGDLSVAQQQIVEIAKALSQEANIIIMDEPTAALTASESEELYQLAEALRDDGKSIIFISHRFEDMYRLASKVTVLRDSQYIGSWDVNGISNHDLIVAMVGREINQLFPKQKVTPKEEVLRVENLSRLGYYNDINFHVKRGEIVALTGLVGAGRTEVVESIAGVTSTDAGSIYLNNKKFEPRNPNHALSQGIGLLPEDRQKEGLILDFSICHNITLSNVRKISNPFWMNLKKENEVAKELFYKLGIKARSIFDKASTLSGGNQQKIVVAKMLTSPLEIIILDEPTKGVDVGAKAAIYEIMSDLAAKGYGVLMISSEMPEVLGMADRIYVMKEGRITGEMIACDATQEKILELSMASQNPFVVEEETNAVEEVV
ncbi:sugar ABC transporter ATP-binding protein [Enterococcus asini]|uniref:sugar ABC transporter ATP-binding protein n=1 Tax=Enterococcus asini TaxID=57732 RepID=UPI000E49C6A6|nr:sugar ABC transporter ATP-binding protein [Enterococcus asini]RGW13383.1 sugar ABC transporter ATP-binding protein [Enterococcus asini]